MVLPISKSAMSAPFYPNRIHVPKTNSVLPVFDGALFSQQWKDALWDKFLTGARAR